MGATRRSARGPAGRRIQMLLRGRNTVGYTPYPTQVTDAFVREVGGGPGVDIFRIFALSTTWPRCDRRDRGRALDGDRRGGGGHVLHGRPPRSRRAAYTHDYYLRLAEEMVEAGGAHVLAVKDMADSCVPPPRRGSSPRFVNGSTSRPRPHARHRGRPARDSARGECRGGRRGRRGRRADCREPRASRRCRRSWRLLAHTERDTGLDLQAVASLEPYWEAVRRQYAPFESGLPARPDASTITRSGRSALQLRQQAIALGLADDFELIEDLYAAADRILGRIPKVTPSSKVVGDLALHLAAVKADPADFRGHPGALRQSPDSVIAFMAGALLGDLPGGWP